MAIITCPECGSKISDKATTCPNCGCPASCFSNSQSVTTNNNVKKETDFIKSEARFENKEKKRRKKGWIIFLIILFILAAIIRTCDYRYYWNKISESFVTDTIERADDWGKIFSDNNGYLIFKTPYVTNSVFPRENKKPMYLVFHNIEGTQGRKGTAVILGDFGNQVGVYYKYRFEITDEDVILMYRYDNKDRTSFTFNENINAKARREVKGNMKRRTLITLDIQFQKEDNTFHLCFDPNEPKSFDINGYNPEKWFN